MVVILVNTFELMMLVYQRQLELAEILHSIFVHVTEILMVHVNLNYDTRTYFEEAKRFRRTQMNPINHICIRLPWQLNMVCFN